ncbi:MAG: hypothetical protein HZA54_01100 [Planctomycetes bacterium]|nr:hypothetical protein [Planctomycetota bacterium]
MPTDDADLCRALDTIIAGRDVKRARHELTLDGRDLTPLFRARLAASGFRPTCVADLEVPGDRRVPAFLIREGAAWFGWVFWEKFTDTKRRRLWGSVLKNAHGDWAIQLGAGDRTELFAAPERAERIDPDHPSPW